MVRLAVNGTGDDIALWQQMQDQRPARRDAEEDEEAAFRASLRDLGFDMEDPDGQ